MTRFPAPYPPGSLAASPSGKAALVARGRWQPGLATTCRHAEIFAPMAEASGAAVALALACDAAAAAPDLRPWLWVQDKAARRLGGRPYRLGLPADLRLRLIHVAADTPEDALFALEEGARCRDLAFVVGEVAGNPKALDLTASRRLSLTAEKHGVPLWLVRLGAQRDLGSARLRWEVRSAPSPRPRWNAYAPGTPAWEAELFRAHTYQPGRWILRDDARLVAEPAAPPHHGDLAGAVGARSLAAR